MDKCIVWKLSRSNWSSSTNIIKYCKFLYSVPFVCLYLVGYLNRTYTATCDWLVYCDYYYLYFWSDFSKWLKWMTLHNWNISYMLKLKEHIIKGIKCLNWKIIISIANCEFHSIWLRSDVGHFMSIDNQIFCWLDLFKQGSSYGPSNGAPISSCM